MVSVLSKIFGTEYLETAEDVVQQTFIDAIRVWKIKGLPDNPSAWLFRVAKNKAIDVLRKNKQAFQHDFNGDERLLLTSEYTLIPTMENLWREEIIQDNQLSMMFACCNPGISPENQITLILKTLCGFSTAEIAKSFLTSEDTISKRLYRTKEFFRAEKIKFEIPEEKAVKERTNAVLNSIYLLFNEGYNSTHSNEIIRRDLIDEAMLLCKLLSENKHTQLPEVFALMALMSFHSARTESRITADGDIILLGDQDRKKWDKDLIAQGNRYMNIAAFGTELSTYHLEAAIAYQHCIAVHVDDTNWKQILLYYEWLIQLAPNPVTELNRCIAVMQVYGAKEAFIILENISDKKKLESYYLYHSLCGELYHRLHATHNAIQSFEKAISLTQSEAEKNMLRKRIGELM